MGNYEKFIAGARDKGVDPGSTEKLKTRILDVIISQQVESSRGMIFRFLFGWTEMPWLRSGMVITSMVVVVMIFIQQFMLVDRMGAIENRIITISTENVISFQKAMMHANSNLVTMSDEIFTEDSIKVAGKDLGSLVRSYRELQSRYEELLEIIENSDSREQVEQLLEKDKLKL
jgi:hypothetical protein